MRVFLIALMVPALLFGQLLRPNHFPINREGLVGWWMQRNTGAISSGGVWVDYSGGGNDGTLNSGATVSANGLTLDSATSDYLFIGNPTDVQITSELTVMSWVKTSTRANQRVVSKDNVTSRSYANFINANGFYGIAIWDSGAAKVLTTNAETVDDGGWHFLASTVGTGGIVNYIDGDFSNELVGSFSIDNDPAPLEFGRRQDSTQYLDGQVDAVLILNRALSAEEIKILYQHQRGMFK